MLSKIYADKQIKSKIEEQRKENKLKEYEEFKSKGIFGKLGDESASDDEKDKQPVDNEKLWNVFAHKEVNLYYISVRVFKGLNIKLRILDCWKANNQTRKKKAKKERGV